MHISAVMVTLGRPQLVEQALRMFELQTHKDSNLTVIDTANQMPACEGDRWRIVPQAEQDWSLAKTVNDAIAMSQGPVIARWDDDDQYFPWHLEAINAAMAHGPWACPSVVWDHWQPDELILTKTAAQPDGSDVCYAGCWAFRKSAWAEVGGYPTHAMAEKEVDFRTSLFKKFGSPADSISEAFPMPSYCYCRFREGAAHDSCATDEERMARRKKPYPKVAMIWPRWPDHYMLGFPKTTTVIDRKW